MVKWSETGMAESVSQPAVSVEQVIQDPQLLAHFYRFSDWDSVLAFLNEDQSLVRLLWDVLPVIQDHFEHSPLTL